MAKTLTEAPLTTRAARAKLPPGIHFKGIDPEVHLGYRKRRRGGVWFVRWRNGVGYAQKSIGTADDELHEGTLTFDAAVRLARKTVEGARREAKAAADGPVLTVRKVVEAYIAERDKRESNRRGRPVRSDATQRLARYVIGREKRGKREAITAAPLASVALHALSEDDLTSWRDGLPDTLKATTRQRLSNDLKAALNSAYAAHRKRLDPSLPAIIKQGLATGNGHGDEEQVARENQILSDAQVGRLIGAARDVDASEEWDGDLYRFVVVLAATGARFSQIARMRVGDVQRKAGRLMVPASRKGWGKKVAETAVSVGTDVLDALLPAVTGRPADAWLLERWRHKQAPGGIEWKRDGRGPWQSASELLRPWAAIRRRAKMPDVIPYALRHSSIVRGIRIGLPIRLVAALHDTSVQMIEQHYSRWIVDGLDELAARAVVPLVPDARGKVVQLRRR